MKKSFTCLLSLSFVAYWSGASVYAQGKGIGHSSLPPVSQGHGPSSNRGPVKTTSGQSGEHSKDQPTKTTWETKFNERLQNDPAFAKRIQDLLPLGMDPAMAADGFKNHGQFIAALHVSHNLNIPFDQLKAKMTGVTTTTTASGTTETTTTTPMSLGKAIHELEPTLTTTQVTVEVKKAEQEANLTEKNTPTS